MSSLKQDKKAGRMSVNLTPTDKSDFENIAETLGISAGGLATKLIESYLYSKKVYGNQVFYPPKYHTFESIKIQEDIDERDRLDPANESSRQKAG
ncbi:MAG: hypothetical protein V3V05_10950 [Pontiella sp.]